MNTETYSMKTLKQVMAILAVIGVSACDSGSIDNSYDDNYFEEETGGKESWGIDYEEEIPQRVRLKETRMPDEYILRLELWSSLPEILEGVSFKYGVRAYWEEKTNSGHWVTRASDAYLVDLNEKTEHFVFENFINGVDSDFTMYYRVYNTLTSKINSGETLSETQQKLLQQVKEILPARVRDFTYSVFVEIYGVKYPVDGYWEDSVEPR